MVGHDELVGRTLGEFVVRDRIGEGGFGAVYRAEQPLLGREAVVKVLQMRLRKNETAIQRFLREARLASRLDHPYAAHIYAFGVEKDGLLWIAMELVDGMPLDRLLRERGRLPLDQAVPLIERLCEVIHTAHGKNIIHRDIKPSNVMVLSRSGQLLPKLLDLGIAKTVTAPIELEETQHGNGSAASREDVIADGATAQLDDPHAPVQVAGRQLTLDGTVLGSPPYMAPEQWQSSVQADERTDLYALAILAFEVIAGRRPFEGRTVTEMCIAHAEHPVPPIGVGPAALDAVFAKALAKLPADRYASTLELARAIRVAAGLAVALEPVPQLESSVREAWISGAPQPIAETIAALEAACSVREARDAYRDVHSALAHYLGVLALACHSKAGATTELAALELLRELRRRRFTDDDWHALAGSLAGTATAIPELVAAVTALVPAKMPALLQAKTDRQIGELLVEALAELGEQLDRLAFLLRYPLAVARDDRIELWMGVRRPRRISVPNDAGVSSGPVLLDATSQVLLDLSPLVEIAPPTPGAADELFLFDGRGVRGARLVALPVGFERHREDVWDWLGTTLLDSLEISTSLVPDGDARPYPGLSAFTSEDAARFFGRDQEVETFSNRLRVQSLLAVVGASGSGKSSFVQAGIVPNLPDGWRAYTIRPGPTPLASLEAVLRKLDVPATELARDPSAFGRELRAAGEAGTVVVVIDQFEELFTHVHELGERLAFAEAIASAVRAPEDPVRVILTLRDDFLIAAEQLSPLHDRLSWGLQLLATPGRDQLVRILAEPARRAGFAFDDPRLVEEMVDTVIDKPGSLALLAFTAAELWAQRDRKAKQLTRASYDAMGGVGGALAKHADGVVEGMVSDERRLVREVFRHVVTAEGTRAVIKREDLRRMLGDSRIDAVLGKLIDARLLVTSEGPESEDRVEIVHEALIEAWPRLRDWLREDTEGARLRDQLRAAAKQWHDRGRPDGLLWRGDALAEYERWRKRHPGRLAEVDDAFASASLADAARGRRIRNASIAGGFALLSIAVAILVYLRSAAERERVRAEELSGAAQQQYVAGLVEQGRRALLAGDSAHAAGYLADAYARGVRGRALGMMLARAVEPLRARLRSFAVGAPVRYAELSPDGTKIAVARVGDRHVSVFDVASGVEQRFDTGDVNVLHVRFDANGTRLASGGVAPRIWDLGPSAKHVALVQGVDRRSVDDLRWTPDGRVVGNTATTVYVWDAATGAIEHQSAPIDNVFTRLAVDRTLVATGDYVGLVRIWDLASLAPRRELRGHAGMIRGLAFSPDGTKLGTASEDKTARVWDVATGVGGPKLAHEAAVWSIAFGASGVLTASMDRTAKLWDADGKLVRSLAGHRGQLASATIDPNGTRALTSGPNARACIHDLASGALLDCLEGHAVAITAGQWSRDGSIMTASLDGTVRLWRGDGSRFSASLAHRTLAGAFVFAPDGRTIATTDEDGLVRLSTIDGKTLWSVSAHEHGPSISFAPEGKQLMTADSEAKIWDVESGALRTTIPSSEGTYFNAAKLLADVIVLCTDDGTIEVRSRIDPLQVRRSRPHHARVYAMAVSPDGTRVATASADGTAAIVDVRMGTQLHVLPHGEAVRRVEFSADGSLIATASFDRVARIWRADGTLVRAFATGAAGDIQALRFDRTGTRLITAQQDGTIRIWRIEGSEAAVVLRGHENAVESIAVDPLGQFVASAGRDGNVWLWDLERKVAVLRLEGHTERVEWIGYSADGKFLATGSWDGTVKLWRIDDGGTSLEDEVALARTVQDRP